MSVDRSGANKCSLVIIMLTFFQSFGLCPKLVSESFDSIVIQNPQKT